MNVSRDLVSAALINPSALVAWPLSDWDLLVRQARRANLLARLAIAVEESGLWYDIPAAPRAHLMAAHILPKRQQLALTWEVRKILQAVAKTGVQLILLKGTAYVMAGLPPARGRIFADIDILVPKQSLPNVEAALMMHGWHTTHHNAYDQRYYRRWMHELPPMLHVMRHSVIDVHHAILPITGRLKPDSEKLRSAAVPIDASGKLFALAPADMLLHSATHLFHDGELEHGLRDLLDLDELLRDFGCQEGFWERLIPRAAELDLDRPLFYALRYTTRIFGTPIPAEVIVAANAGSPPKWLLLLMDALFLRALRPDHSSAADRWTPLARKMLYIRSHWLRMPLPLLAVHLTVKKLRRKSENE